MASGRPVREYRTQSRGGKGIITMKTNDKNGAVMGARQVLPKDDVMLVSNKGQMIRIHVGEISEQGRNTQGVRLMTMSSALEKVVSFEYMAESNVGNGIFPRCRNNSAVQNSLSAPGPQGRDPKPGSWSEFGDARFYGPAVHLQPLIFGERGLQHQLGQKALRLGRETLE